MIRRSARVGEQASLADHAEGGRAAEGSGVASRGPRPRASRARLSLSPVGRDADVGGASLVAANGAADVHAIAA